MAAVTPSRAACVEVKQSRATAFTVWHITEPVVMSSAMSEVGCTSTQTAQAGAEEETSTPGPGPVGWCEKATLHPQIRSTYRSFLLHGKNFNANLAQLVRCVAQ